MSQVHPHFLELDNNERINALYQAIQDVSTGRALNEAVFERTAEPALSQEHGRVIAEAVSTLEARLSRLEAAMGRLLDQLSVIKGP